MTSNNNMAANAANQWSHTVPLDQAQHENEYPRTASRTGNRAYQDTSNYAYGTVGKRPSDSNMRGDGDSSRSRRPSGVSSQSVPRKRSAKPLKQQQQPVEDSDDGWIHRDKLREIEIQEMEQAGMRVRQPRRSGSAGPSASQRSSSRSISRSGVRRQMSREQLGESPVEDASGFGDFKRKRVSTIPAADASEEQEAEFDHMNDSEIRNLEELAASQPSFKQPTGRPSTSSRIPVSKVSPLPLPHTVVDRESPLPRSRHGSTGWSGNWDELQYARRARSGSVGSQVLLDDDGYRTPSRPVSTHIRGSPEDQLGYSHSPPKARVPTKDTPTSGARKASGGRSLNSGTKPRARSGTTGARPPSSSGPKHPINRPEGEAPWLANMYKPDPRLPPDQQMLPTHAKRIAEQHWDPDTNAGASQLEERPDPEHERQDQGLELHEHRSISPIKSEPPPNPQEASGWPLGSDKRSEPGSPRPGTSGGYRITPTIASRPNLPRNPTSEKDTAPPHNPTPRIPDFDDKEDEGPQQPQKKKGCMGCVVM